MTEEFVVSLCVKKQKYMYHNRVTNVYFVITVLHVDLRVIRCFPTGLKIDYGGLCDAGDVCMGENTECSLTDNRCRCVQGFAIDFVTGLCGLFKC